MLQWADVLSLVQQTQPRLAFGALTEVPYTNAKTAMPAAPDRAPGDFRVVRPGEKHWAVGWQARSRWEINGYSSKANVINNTLNWQENLRNWAKQDYKWAGLIPPTERTDYLANYKPPEAPPPCWHPESYYDTYPEQRPEGYVSASERAATAQPSQRSKSQRYHAQP